MILLVIASGGVIRWMLQDSGLGNIIGPVLEKSGLPLILIAFLIAVLVRASVGSSIVAMTMASGIMATMPAVMDKIWADYPNLSISRVASRSQLTVEDLLSGKVDFHIGYRNNMSSSNGLDIHDLMQDPVVFAISRSLFHKTFGEAAEILLVSIKSEKRLPLYKTKLFRILLSIKY